MWNIYRSCELAAHSRPMHRRKERSFGIPCWFAKSATRTNILRCLEWLSAVDGCWSVGHWHAKWNFETISGNFRKPHRNQERSIERANCHELSCYTKVRYIELLKHTSSILSQVTARAFLGTWHYIPGKTAGWHTNPKNLLQSTSLLRWGN